MTMNQLLILRDQIHDYFEGNEDCQAFFRGPDKKDTYAAYYTSKYLIQDTCEAMMAHRHAGFSSSHSIAYLEFWGIMQAIIVQQDAIRELHKAIIGTYPKPNYQSSWHELRKLRNVCAGHPANLDRDAGKKAPSKRTFMGRGFGNYDSITYEVWDASTPSLKWPDHPKVELGKMIDSYAAEATELLQEILNKMKCKWP